MNGTMQGVTLIADWQPKPAFRLGAKDIDGRQTYLGSQVWRNPCLEIREYHIPDFTNWKDHDAFEAGFTRLIRDLKAEDSTAK